MPAPALSYCTAHTIIAAAVRKKAWQVKSDGCSNKTAIRTGHRHRDSQPTAESWDRRTSAATLKKKDTTAKTPKRASNESRMQQCRIELKTNACQHRLPEEQRCCFHCHACPVQPVLAGSAASQESGQRCCRSCLAHCPPGQRWHCYWWGCGCHVGYHACHQT